MFQSACSILLAWQVLLRLFIAFFLPYILFAGIITATADQVNIALGGEENEVKVGVVGLNEIPLVLLSKLKEQGELKEMEEAIILSALDDDSIDIGLVFPIDFYADSIYTGTVKAYHNMLENSAQPIFDVLEEYEDELIAQEIEKIGLDKAILDPIAVEITNTFNPIFTLGSIMEQIKGGLSNVLNLLFVLLVLWLIRNLVLRAAFVAPAKFWINLAFIFVGTLLGMFLVFLGFQSGINTDQEGMIRSLILSIQQLLVWNKLSSIFLLWIPVWLLIIGLLGCIVAFSKRMIDAYLRTFWGAVILNVVCLLGMLPIVELSTIDAYLPLWNVFRMGQLAMKGNLDPTTWYLALGTTTAIAFAVIGVWYRQYHKMTSE